MLLGFALLIPAYLLSSHLLPWTSFQQEVCAAASTAVIVFAALLKREGWRWPLLATAIAAASLIPLFQIAAGRLLYAADGVLAALYLIGFALCITCGARLVATNREDLLNGLHGVFLLCALASTVVALCQWLGVTPGFFGITPISGGRVTGNIGQPNHLATLLLLGLVGAGWFFHRQRIGKGVLLLMALLLCVGLALSQSRQAWVGLAAVTAWSLIALKRGQTTIPGWWLAAFGAGLVAALIALPPLNSALLLSAGRSAEEFTAQGTRLVHWSSMLDAIGRAPWLGYGWNELAVAQSAAAADHPATYEVLDHSHNLLIDLMVWNGVPLGLLLFGVLAWWWWRHLRHSADAASAFLLASLLVIFVHAMFEYPLSYAYFLLPAGLMMGAVDGLSPIDRGVRVPRVVAIAIALGGAAATTAVVRDYVSVDAAYRQMRLEKFIVGAHPQAAPEILVLTNWRDFIELARTEARAGMDPAWVDKMRNVRMRHPHPAILLRFALVAGLNGRPEEARSAMVLLCKVHVPQRCREGLESWRDARQRYPQLGPIEVPAEQ